MKKCHKCKGSNLQPGMISHSLKFSLDGDKTILFKTEDLPALVCADCGESTVSYETMKSFELAVAKHLAGLGHPMGSAFRYMRKALGMPAARLSELLGVTPETMSRWETGDRPVSVQAFALLGSLVSDACAKRTETHDRLAAMNSPGPIPSQIPLALSA